MLDLFAGTGALGLEALSRGAERAVFVEHSAGVLRAARQNAESLGVADQCVFQCTDVASFLSQLGGRRFDLILADPPYTLPALLQLPALTADRLEPWGLLVLEHDVRHRFAAMSVVSSRRYGRTVVTVFSQHP